MPCKVMDNSALTQIVEIAGDLALTEEGSSGLMK
jgi:hypothetical protein